MAGIKKQVVNGAKAYVVNGRPFQTKDEVTEAVRVILYGREPGEAIDAESFAFINALLSFHRHAPVKIGCGIAAITVERNPEFPSKRGFWISRTDGSRTDFSFVECISPAPAIRDLKWALRFEVKEQVLSAKEAAFGRIASIICPVSGDSLTRDNCHVDHAPPRTFDVLASEFIAAHGVDADAVSYIGGDGVIGEVVADRELAAKWREFHLANATLRVISQRANLSDVVRGFNKDRREGGTSC